MKLHGCLIGLLVAALLISLILPAEGGPAKRRGGKNRRRTSKKKNSGGKTVKRLKTCPCECPSPKNRCPVPEGNGGSKEGVNDSVQTTLEKMRALRGDLETLMGEMSGAYNMTVLQMNAVYSGFAITELNPTNKLRLKTDQKMPLLGEMIWWVNWIGASLEVLQKINDSFPLSPLPLVSAHKNPHNPHHNVTLRSVHSLLKNKLQVSLFSLLGPLGYDPKRNNGSKGKDPLQCLRVKVIFLCGKKLPICTEERERAFVILRDAHRAVDRMYRQLKLYSVREGKHQTQVMNSSVFYEKACVSYVCPLQKSRCKRCLSWDFV